MKQIFSFVFLMIGILLVFKGKAFSAIQDKPNFTNLTLEIKASRTEWLQFEPIFLDLKISNKTEEPIIGYMGLDFTFSPIKINIIHKSTRIRIDRLSLEKGCGDTSFRLSEIKPGEFYKSTQVLFIDLEKVFIEPGQYQIQATLYNFDGKFYIESNLLTINLRKPKGVDLKARNYIAKSNVTFTELFNTLSFHLDENMLKTLKDIATNYTGSIYADYANCWLAIDYFFKGNYQVTTKILESLEVKTGLFCREKVLYYLTVSNLKLGNVAKGKYYSKMLKESYPQSQYTYANEIQLSSN